MRWGLRRCEAVAGLDAATVDVGLPGHQFSGVGFDLEDFDGADGGVDVQGGVDRAGYGS